MGIEVFQTDKGAYDLVNDADAVRDFKVGGPAAPTASIPRYYGSSRVKMPLAAKVDSGGGVLSWQNPFNYSLMVTECILDVSTVATASCTLEAGVTASSATTAATNFISSQDVHSALGTFNSGAKSVKLAAGAWFTISTASGASTGLVGNAYIDFTPA
jgi:hypothetical protein